MLLMLVDQRVYQILMGMSLDMALFLDDRRFEPWQSPDHSHRPVLHQAGQCRDLGDW